jgi:predicted nuclease with TOPRIM domain
MNEILLAIIAILGSTSAWQYYERRSVEKKEHENWVKMDCSKRIEKLELLLSESSKEKEELRKTILELTAQVSELRVKIEYLEKESTILHKKVL